MPKFKIHFLFSIFFYLFSLSSARDQIQSLNQIESGQGMLKYYARFISQDRSYETCSQGEQDTPEKENRTTFKTKLGYWDSKIRF